MYTKIVEIDGPLLEKLEDGAVTLRPGQWVRLPWSSQKARWVGLSPAGVCWIQHSSSVWEGSFSQRTFCDMVTRLRAVRGEA